MQLLANEKVSQFRRVLLPDSHFAVGGERLPSDAENDGAGPATAARSLTRKSVAVHLPVRKRSGAMKPVARKSVFKLRDVEASAPPKILRGSQRLMFCSLVWRTIGRYSVPLPCTERICHAASRRSHEGTGTSRR